jgi:hypothetical protein
LTCLRGTDTIRRHLSGTPSRYLLRISEELRQNPAESAAPEGRSFEAEGASKEKGGTWTFQR